VGIVSAFASIFSIASMILIGFFIARKGWMTDEVGSFIAKVVVNVAVPANLLYIFTNDFTRQMLLDFRFIILIPFAVLLLNYGLSEVFVRLLKIPLNRQGLFRAMFTLSNVGFMGIPVNFALFGDTAGPAIYMFFAVNTLIFWTIGIGGIKRDASRGISTTPANKKFEIKNILKLFTGGLAGIIFGILLVLFDVRFPPFINNTLLHLGALVTPLPMLFIGGVFAKADWKKFRLTKDLFVITLSRFAFAPLLVVGFVTLARNFIIIEPLTMQVFVIQAAMPVMMQAPILTKEFNGDYEYATMITTITTLLSLLAIPIIRVLLG